MPTEVILGILAVTVLLILTEAVRIDGVTLLATLALLGISRESLGY